MSRPATSSKPSRKTDRQRPIERRVPITARTQGSVNATRLGQRPALTGNARCSAVERKREQRRPDKAVVEQQRPLGDVERYLTSALTPARNVGCGQVSFDDARLVAVGDPWAS